MMFVLGLSGILVLDAVFTIGRSYVTGWSAARLQHILGVTMVERLLAAELSAVESVAPGVLLQRLRAIDTIKSFYAGQAMLAAIDLPFIFLFLGIMALIGSELALFPVAALIFTLIAALITGKTLRSALKERAIRDERRQNFIVEVLNKTTTIKALGLEQFLCRRYERLQGASAEMSFWVTFHSSIARSIGGLFPQITMAGVAAYGSTMVMAGNLSVGSLAACTFLAGRAAQPTLRAFGLWTQFQSIAIASQNINFLLEVEQEQPTAMPRKTVDDGDLEGRIVVSGLDFGYGEDPTGLFGDVDFTLDPGETVAISGANGTGKTTLMQLLSGLLVPSAGEVLIDGHAPRYYDLASLRRQICHIPQTTTLFKGTILENLTGFGDDVSIDIAVELAEQLGLSKVVSRLPMGFETLIGEGANDGLPGGIRQLICIARAFAKTAQPPIILFDEANSQLDRASDDRVHALLGSYRGRSSIIIVSHRPSYLALAERHYVLRDGSLYPAPNSPKSKAVDRGRDPGRDPGREIAA